MIRGPTAAGLTVLLAACATTPLAPDPAVDVTGRWTIVAVDGEPTGGGRRFNLEVKPPVGSAQFGCNAGGGSLAIGNGWLVAGDPWIFTVAGCPDPSTWMEFERKGIQILARPLAIERRPSAGVRLRNERGSIDLVSAPPVTAAEIAGTWDVVSINGVGTPGGERFRVRIRGNELDAYFGCNRYSAEFAIENGHYAPRMARTTEMACEPTGPNAPSVPVMTLEDRAFAVLRSRPEVVIKPNGAMALVSPRGTIELTRSSEPARRR